MKPPLCARDGIGKWEKVPNVKYTILYTVIPHMASGALFFAPGYIPLQENWPQACHVWDTLYELNIPQPKPVSGKKRQSLLLPIMVTRDRLRTEIS